MGSSQSNGRDLFHLALPTICKNTEVNCNKISLSIQSTFSKKKSKIIIQDNHP
jgi:hypothetical protein